MTDPVTGTPVEIALPLSLDRNVPIRNTLDAVRMLQASGVVDYVHGWDQLCGRWPAHLWSEQNSPWAATRPDAGSLHDAISMLAAAAAAAAAVAPDIGIALSTDSIRRGPAELMQTMLTLSSLSSLSSLSGGKAHFHFGAGELKNTTSFGWKRTEGLRRQEDLFQLFERFWTADGPFDFDGNLWHLRNAWLGSTRQHRPRFWGLGGGPKLINLSTSYASGFATLCRGVGYTSERWHSMVTTMKRQLEDKARDPETFHVGLYAMVALHEDDAVIDAALHNPLLKWMVAIIGRVLMADWDHAGIAPPMPRDWHYANHLLPVQMGVPESDRLLSSVTDEMIDASWIRGTPEKVAAELQAYVDAGATWVSLIDLLPVVRGPGDAPAAVGRSLEVAARLKGLPA